MPAKKKAGRPKGAKNVKVEAESTRVVHTCPRCGSEHRTAYTTKPRVVTGKIPGPDGIYKKAEFRRTKCTECGLHRFDKTLIGKIKS